MLSYRLGTVNDFHWGFKPNTNLLNTIPPPLSNCLLFHTEVFTPTAGHKLSAVKGCSSSKNNKKPNFRLYFDFKNCSQYPKLRHKVN